MKPFLKVLLAALAAIGLIHWFTHRNDAGEAAEACRVGDEWE